MFLRHFEHLMQRINFSLHCLFVCGKSRLTVVQHEVPIKSS